MKPLVLAALVSSVCCAAPVTNLEDGLKAAKSSNSPVVVLVHGSDWNAESEQVAKIFQDPRMATALGNAQLVLIDKKQNVLPDKAEQEKNKELRTYVSNIPTILVYDADARPIAIANGMPAIQAAGGPVQFCRRALDLYQKREATWNSAKGQAGDRKVALLGQGLEMLGDYGNDRSYSAVLEEIKKADPEDKLGYVGKITFSGQGLTDRMLWMAGKKEFAEAEQFLVKTYQNPRLSTQQRQQVFAARYALYSRWPEKKEQIPSVFSQMQKLDPNSELGKAAGVYLENILKEKK